MVQPAQLPELKMFNPMAPLQAYYQGKSDAMQMRQQEQQTRINEMQMRQQEMQLAEYEQDAPYRKQEGELNRVKKIMETDQQMIQFGRQMLTGLDPEAEDFDQKAVNVAVEMERYLVERANVSPETAGMVIGNALKAGAFSRESVMQEQIKQGLRPEPGKREKPQIVDGQQIIVGEDGMAKAVPIPGFVKQEKTVSTPATDIDDYVADFEAQYIQDNGEPPPPGLRNKARLDFKRAQSDEVFSNRLASRTADAETAERIAYNGEIGTQLAVIETASSVAEAKGEITPQEKASRAKRGVTGRLASLGGLYAKLDSMGAIVNIDNDTPQNIWASARSSKIGQRLGKAIGTEDQSLRSTIDAIKPLLIQDIRQSTDMGARGLDSEKELEFYLQAATDTQKDIQANIAAIVVLDEAFGDGSVADKLRPLTTTKKITEISSKGAEILGSGERKQLDADTARRYLQEAGGDKQKAREMAKTDGYTF